ncbi:MAG: alkyl hydroperoxide reductase [Chloroflexi bacterium]|nr:alkyl hydroperoxide reductase [Chloroflexota bacterium]
MHILPQLRKLERKHRETLAVIGVHSSKFPNERDTRNIRNAIVRYGVEHPVVNDRDFTIWRTYAVRAWPTLMFIDPAGKVIGKHEGEFEFARFDELIGDMVDEFEAGGTIDRRLQPYQLEADRLAARPLSFPGKIEVDPGGNRILIADSNHDRILVISPEGELVHLIGTGEPGFADGECSDAQFNKPQGMAVTKEFIYVADAENHAIRKVDRSRHEVTTIAGTGEQALYRHQGGDALQHPLSSPYDLTLQDGTLYIAMAGFHQLWALDLEKGKTAPFAGDGGEDIVDGPVARARLAQPYGVKAEGGRLYFTDSETSSVRTAGTGADARVTTLVGKGLFEFGDLDGVGEKALLQHCQGLALRREGGETVVYVADTYNHKIKWMTTVPKVRVETFSGTGTAGRSDGPARSATFDEPAGLAVLGSKLYVADTNNHAVRVVDLEAPGHPVRTLEIRIAM